MRHLQLNANADDMHASPLIWTLTGAEKTP